ncbi:hypothetical protein [Natronomonas sp.]|jgi:hypothetical protein|uniref:hypothetical protein n=1 Tax=Natronomonas sp. TaxID=2184060 RepID=UPI0026228F90|nr:hypothetical protein [Natronomonas sp.]
MRRLVADPVVRTATFFALAFCCAAVGGVLIGTPRVGIRWGFGLGVAFAAFAYLFVRPTDDAEPPGPNG